MAYQSKYTGLQIDDLLDSVGGKQNEIEDLDSIRAGAAKGATALQSYTEKYTGTVTGIKINGVVKSGSGIIDLGTISTDISGKVDKVAGKQLSTEDFTTALKNKLEGLNNYDDTELSNAVETLRGDFDSIVSGDTTTAIKTFNEVIAFLDGLTDTQDLESIIASIEQQIAGKMDKVTLASVATSGNYNDLTNKPTIPTKTSELENDSNYIVVDEYGYASIDGTMCCNQVSCDRIGMGEGDIGLSVDENGIYVDLAGGFNFLSITNSGDGSKYLANDGTYKTVSGGSGTITGVSANGTSVATSGVANIPAASTSKYGVTKLSSSTSSTSTSLAATASAVKAAYDLANGKQAKLVSGTNIKTINGTSILGSGDITIEGGGSSYAGNFPIIRKSLNGAIMPNAFNIYKTPVYSYISIQLIAPTNNDILNEYIIVFYSEIDNPQLSMPSEIIWANDDIPTIKEGTTYLLSIINNVATYEYVKGNPYGIEIEYDGSLDPL